MSYEIAGYFIHHPDAAQLEKIDRLINAGYTPHFVGMTYRDKPYMAVYLHKKEIAFTITDDVTGAPVGRVYK